MPTTPDHAQHTRELAAADRMTVTEIQSELFRLQGHVCNGRLTIHPDGTRDPDDQGCDGCGRYLLLANRLRELEGR